MPPNVRVINETHSVMSNVRSRADELPPDGPPATNAPVIRLTGFALMSDVEVVVRRREDPVTMTTTMTTTSGSADEHREPGDPAD